MVSTGSSRQGLSQSVSRFDPSSDRSKAYEGEAAGRARTMGTPMDVNLPGGVTTPLTPESVQQGWQDLTQATENPLSNLQLNQAQQQLLQMTRDQVLGNQAVRGLEPTRVGNKVP